MSVMLRMNRNEYTNTPGHSTGAFARWCLHVCRRQEILVFPIHYPEFTDGNPQSQSSFSMHGEKRGWAHTALAAAVIERT